MKTIFITISRGSLIRNFFHTGIVSRLLKNGLRVVVLTPYYDQPEFFSGYGHQNLVFEPLIVPQRLKIKKILDEFFKGAVFNKTVHVRYKYRFSGSQPQKIYYLPRLLFFAPLGFMPGFKKLIRLIDGCLNPQPEHDYLFKKYSPDLIFVTSASDYAEAGILKGAKRFKVKSICMPKSWDNLSKILFAGKADYMLVWSQFMTEQAAKFQDYKPDQIIIAGISQFDFYQQIDDLSSREEFCRQFNFNPDKKIILYGSTGGNSFKETEYIELIKQYIDEGRLKEVQVLVRPHLGYLNDDKKFVGIEKYHGFVVDRTDTQNKRLKDHWDISESHHKHLFNSLHHADICLNIASTLTLDAIACGTPVININFDVDEKIALGDSTKRFYTTDYIKAVTNLGASWLANSKEEFLSALIDVLDKNKNKDDKQGKFIEYFMYKNDGQAAERISQKLILLAEGKNL